MAARPWPRSARARATASAGTTWPPVPPPATTAWRRLAVTAASPRRGRRRVAPSPTWPGIVVGATLVAGDVDEQPARQHGDHERGAAEGDEGQRDARHRH